MKEASHKREFKNEDLKQEGFDKNPTREPTKQGDQNEKASFMGKSIEAPSNQGDLNVKNSEGVSKRGNHAHGHSKEDSRGETIEKRLSQTLISKKILRKNSPKRFEKKVTPRMNR